MCSPSGGSGLVLSSGSDLKNRRAETYLGALWASQLLEGESKPGLQERSCWDCWNSDAVVAPTLAAQSSVGILVDHVGPRHHLQRELLCGACGSLGSCP